MTGLADVDGFQISIQVCVWPRFPPLITDSFESNCCRDFHFPRNFAEYHNQLPVTDFNMSRPQSGCIDLDLNGRMLSHIS